MKKILFTGARSGIAHSVIEKLKDKDYYIYVTVHTNNELKSVKEKYQENKNIEFFKLDVTNKSDKEKLKDLDIDILVSNAAISYGGSIAEIDINKIRENYEINVFNYFEIVQIVLKNMIKKGTGKIINIASLAGIVPIPFIGSYCSTKASIIKLSECLNLELKYLDEKIKICIVEPGLYKTGFNQYMFDNKYDNHTLYFKKYIDEIRTMENILLLMEKKNLNSISKKIVNAISSDNPKRIIRAPFFQVLGAKIYQIFFS